MTTQKSEIECHNCNEQNYVREDGELWCENCHFTPSGGPSTRKFFFYTAWETWQHGRRQAEKRDARPYCVGGAPEAYEGDGEYEVDDDGNFNTPPKYKIETSWRNR